VWKSEVRLVRDFGLLATLPIVTTVD
jgi:hypothetical protein